MVLLLKRKIECNIDLMDETGLAGLTQVHSLNLFATSCDVVYSDAHLMSLLQN